MYVLKSVGNIEYKIDFKIELVSIIMYLGKTQRNEHLFSNIDSEYLKNIEQYFSKYKDHEAVKLFTKLFDNNFNYDKPYTFIYTLESMPLRQNEKYEQVLKEYKYFYENKSQIIEALNRFIEDTNFIDFFDFNRTYYEEVLDSLLKNVPSIDILGMQQKYYKDNDNIEIEVTFNILSGNFSSGLEDRICLTICPNVENLLDNDPMDLLYLLVHETSHYYIKKIYDKNKSFFKSKADEFEKIIDNIYGPYRGLATYIQEALVRACSLHILKQNNYDFDKTDEYLTLDSEEYGFKITKIVYDLLLKENNIHEVIKYIKNNDINIFGII